MIEVNFAEPWVPPPWYSIHVGISNLRFRDKSSQSGDGGRDLEWRGLGCRAIRHRLSLRTYLPTIDVSWTHASEGLASGTTSRAKRTEGKKNKDYQSQPVLRMFGRRLSMKSSHKSRAIQFPRFRKTYLSNRGSGYIGSLSARKYIRVLSWSCSSQSQISALLTAFLDSVVCCYRPTTRACA